MGAKLKSQSFGSETLGEAEQREVGFSSSFCSTWGGVSPRNLNVKNKRLANVNVGWLFIISLKCKEGGT